MTDENNKTSLMFSEAQSSAQCVSIQLKRNTDLMTDIGARIRKENYHTIITCARGSSDHASLYGKYLFQTELGINVSSFAPSISSIYKSNVDMNGVLFIGISQSGASPDLIASADMAKANGAYTIAITNNEKSALADISHSVIPLCAGPELSVAATKSFICSLSAIADLTFRTSLDLKGQEHLKNLPHLLNDAFDQNWKPMAESLKDAKKLFVLGRGLGLSIAEEAALKFKETSGLHAEAFSSAEVKHGPMALASNGFPVLAFAPSDDAYVGFESLIQSLAQRGANCFVAGANIKGASALGTTLSADRRLSPLLQIQSFYRFVNSYATLRGFNPDTPKFLNKVTETV